MCPWRNTYSWHVIFIIAHPVVHSYLKVTQINQSIKCLHVTCVLLERTHISFCKYQFPACMHRWFCHELVLLLNAGRVQCLWRMCCPILHFREDTMPFFCVLRAAILPLLSTLPPKWRATSLTLMMPDTQPYIGQPNRVSCQWWSTSWDPVVLTWQQGTRLVHVCVAKYHVNVCLC